MTTLPDNTRASVAMSRTALALAALQGALHAFSAMMAGDPRMVLPHAVAWLHDVALLTAVAAMFAFAARLVRTSLRRAVLTAARGAVVAAGLVLALYPQMLQTFMATPVNILQSDAGSAKVFLRDYAGLRVLWPAMVVLPVGLLAPRLRWLRLPGRPAFVGVPLTVLALLTLGRVSPNPVVFSLQDGVQQFFVPRVVPRLTVGRALGGGGTESPPVDWSAARRARYDHLLVVVLESVTSAEFERDFLTIPGGFFDSRRNRARYFSGYHATNLDSYTSLIAMTTSIQVPFRAYADPAMYEAVNRQPNLARGLRTAGCRTLFVSTYEHQPFVPNAQDWDKVLDSRDLGDVSAWVSLGESRMESATEDRAALPAILRFMTAAPRTLVMAELVFGHAPAWRAKTGLTPVGYYDSYLTDLWQRLTQAALSSRTLLVVVSDHGERSLAASPDNYRVPLMVVGAGVEPGRDAEFRSHLDLQAIIGNGLLGSPMPEPRQHIVVVGSTERWVYGEIRRNGDHVFVDDSTGGVLAGNLNPADLHRAFEGYVRSFLSTLR